MKRIVLILLLSYAYIAQAQYLAPLDAKNSGARSVGILVTDSMQNMRFFDTATCKLAFPSKLAGRIARQSGRLYYNPTGTKFVLLDSVVVSSAFDTTNIYAQLALRVKYSDTASMLANYALLSELPNISGKVNYTDTAALLSPYLRKGDTAAMLSPYATDAQVNLKLNITDTANIRLRPIAGTNMTISGTYPNLTFDASGGDVTGGASSTDNAVAVYNGTTGKVIKNSAIITDASGNIRANNFVGGYTTTVTAAGTTTLTVSSTILQFFTGTTTQTVTLPVTSTLTLGHPFTIVNNSTGLVTVNSSGANNVLVLAAGTTAYITCILTSGTTAASWSVDYSGAVVATGKKATFNNTMTFAGTDAQTYTFPTASTTIGGLGTTQTWTGANTFNNANVLAGAATMALFNTTATNISFAGAATTFTAGGTPTTGLTATYFGNATATGQTKTLNFGTGGASGSTTAINIGSATSGATNNIKLNVLPASDATGDIWYRNASGFMTRLGIGSTGQVLTVAAGLPSWATAGAGSGWGLTGNTGLSSTANWVGNNDDISFNVKVNNVFSGEIAPSAYGRTHFGYNAGTGAKTALSFYTTLIGSNAGPSITGNGNTGVGEATFDNGGALTNSVAIGRKAATTLNSGDNNVAIGYFTGLPSMSGSHQLNIQNVIWGVSCNGIYTSPTTPAGRIGIGTNAPNASAILDLTSTSQGFLPPRMTGTQAAAIASKAEGLMVYVTDATGGFAAKGWYGWNGAAWEKLNP